MKRILLLAVGLVLAAAGTSFAQLSFSGQLQYGAISNFDDAPGYAWDNQFIFNAKIDDFNSYTMRIRLRNGNTANAFNSTPTNTPSWNTMWLLSSDAPVIDRAYITSDITGALGVKGPVKDTLTAGFAWVTTADLTDGISPFEVTDLDSDNFIGFGGGKQAVFSDVVTISDVFNLRCAIAPNNFKQGRGGWFVAGDATVDAGPGKLTPEVVYSVNNDAFSKDVGAGKGNFVFAAKYTMDAAKDISLALVPQYVLSLDSDAAIGYYYAVAAKVTYGELVAVSGGFLGYDGSSSNRLEARVVLTPTKLVGLDVGAVFNLDKDVYATASGDSNTLNDLDISAFVNLGKTKVRVGYLFLGEEGFSSVINNDLVRIGYGGSCLKQGGLYLETTVSF